MSEARKVAEVAGTPFPIAENYTVHIHHCISTTQAKAALRKRVKIASLDWPERDYSRINISEGLLLPPSLRMRSNTDGAMLKLCDKYYDHDIYILLKKHCDEAGQSEIGRAHV